MNIKKMIPNILTVLRIVGVVFATMFLFKDDLKSAIIALVLYVLVAATDFFDGYLARKWDVVTAFGKIMDPIADKVYILTLYVSFVLLNVISHWWVWTIVIREIVVTISRLILLCQGDVIAAEKSGKVKAVTQNISVFLLFALFLEVKYLHYLNAQTKYVLVIIAFIALVLAVFLTIYSGIEFYKNNWTSIIKRERE